MTDPTTDYDELRYDGVFEHKAPKPSKLSRVVWVLMGIVAAVIIISNIVYSLRHTDDYSFDTKHTEYKHYEWISAEEANLPQVSFDGLRATLSANEILDEHEKEQVGEYIDVLERKYSGMDLRVFNYNLLTLNIEYVNAEEDDIPESLLGIYHAYLNTIYLYDYKYPEDEMSDYKRHVLYHELTHVLTTAILSEQFVSFSNYYENGIGFEEGTTEVFSEYLLSEETDIHSILEKDHEYFAYQGLSDACAEFMRKIEQEYTFEDFLKGNVEGLEKLLTDYADLDYVLELDEYYHKQYENTY